ncbi:MAG: GAF domain-containing protein [Anaerolineae bacterium]|nr:GAF domain-containing protein [Anaerolineae bacterium]
MGTGLGDGQEVLGASRLIPTTGMRGGLGRTLLTAFLILTILPLTLTVGYATQQNSQNLQREVENKLLDVATLKGEALRRWLNDLQTLLTFSIVLDGGPSDEGYEAWWLTLHEQLPDLTGVVVLDQDQQPVWSVAQCQTTWNRFSPLSGDSLPSTKLTFFHSSIIFFIPSTYHNQTFVFCLDGKGLNEVIQVGESVAGTDNVYLIYRSCIWPDTVQCVLPPIVEQQAKSPGSGVYENHEGVVVIGAYYPINWLDLGVLVEQEHAKILESSDRIAATFIALVLAVALVSTAISAIVIRQITQPVIRLTESALAMAERKLDQHLEVTSRDEIGILTYVFNQMALELKMLYADLEAKVVERTKNWQRANTNLQRRALHLQASQKVSQAITSIRDPDLLLNRVTELIWERFAYTSVAVYMVEPGGGLAHMRALSPNTHTTTTQSGRDLYAWPEYSYPGDGSVVDQAIRKQIPQVDSKSTDDEIEWYRRTLSRVVVPLRMEDRVVGAIAVLSAEREGIQADELEVLESLANQVAIALENARAYERERSATQQLEEAEVFKSHFMANMSHELREPLNTIIGFSRLMIKGLDDPLTSQQRQDLELIYADGQRLLSLINDILDISQIQAGLMELKLQPVDFHEMVSGVMPTANALVRGKDVNLVQEIPTNLPLLRVDPAKIRQVMVNLFSNAAKFTTQGEIKLRAWRNEDDVYVSVSDTGTGIPPEDRDSIFNRFGRSRLRSAQQGAGLGLALSKELIEMHGGKIWMQSEVGEGTTFIFSLPCYISSNSTEIE